MLELVVVLSVDFLIKNVASRPLIYVKTVKNATFVAP